MSSPKIIGYFGSMYSGKTSFLLSYLDRCKWRNKNIKAFKPNIDQRYSNDCICTHLGYKTSAINVSSGQSILNYVSYDPYVEIIFIDEFFMIPGAAKASIELFKSGKSIVIASLDLDSNFNPFPEASAIMPYCTEIHKLFAICSKCDKDAQFTQAIADKDNNISVGGKEKYEPRCFEHYDVIKEKI